MSFDDEMKNAGNAVTGGSYISKPCVEIVTLKSYKMSPNDHKGCPYIEVMFETVGEEKLSASTRLYRVREGDSEGAIEFKNKRIKELFTNAGGDFALKGEAIIKSAMGGRVKALFKEQEYIGVDGNNNNKPEIRTKIEYSFSTKEDLEIKGNQSYFKSPLNDKALKQYEGDLAKWERDNGSSEASTAQPVEATEKIDPLPPAFDADDDDDVF
jgi:hypothetical protein